MVSYHVDAGSNPAFDKIGFVHDVIGHLQLLIVLGFIGTVND